MKEVVHKKAPDESMCQNTFTLTCSRCHHVWRGENEAAVDKLIQTEKCKCTEYLDNLSQDELKDEINGVLNYNAEIDAKPEPKVNEPLREVDW